MNKEINLVYRFIEQGSEVQESCYEILQLFTEEGPVSSKIVKEVYRDFTLPQFGELLRFTSIEALGKFTLELLRESNSREAFLISTSDYNIGLESVNETEEFKSIFRRFGTSVENPDSNIKKTNIFNKLFK